MVGTYEVAVGTGLWVRQQRAAAVRVLVNLAPTRLSLTGSSDQGPTRLFLPLGACFSTNSSFPFPKPTPDKLRSGGFFSSTIALPHLAVLVREKPGPSALPSTRPGSATSVSPRDDGLFSSYFTHRRPPSRPGQLAKPSRTHIPGTNSPGCSLDTGASTSISAAAPRVHATAQVLPSRSEAAGAGRGWSLLVC